MGNERGDQYQINGLRELTFDLFCSSEEATLVGHRVGLYLDLDLLSFWNSEDTV